MFVNDLFENNKITEGSVQDKLHRRHQELRKKSGLPDPDYYKELKASYDIEDDAKRIAAQAEIKKKYRVAEAGPFSYGAKKPRKGSVADLAAKKRKEQEKNKKPIEPKDQMVGVAKVVTNEDAVGKVLGKMVPGAGSAINAVDSLRRFQSGDKVGAGIAAAGTLPLVQYPALATDIVRDKVNTGKWLPSEEERSKALSQPAADISNGYLRSADRHTIMGPVTKPGDPDDLKNRSEWLRKTLDLPKSKSVPDSMQPDSTTLPSKKYPEVTNEDIEGYLEEMRRAGYDIVTEAATLCPECGGPAYNNQMLAEKQDACYHKVKSRYKVWPSAYASGALVRCRKKGAKNWGNKSKK